MRDFVIKEEELEAEVTVEIQVIIEIEVIAGTQVTEIEAIAKIVVKM
jgi:hypothetical protein